jgi:hypothetical protein
MEDSKILSSGMISENMFYCITEYNKGEYYGLYCLDNVIYPPKFTCNADIDSFISKHDCEGYGVSGTLGEIMEEYKELLL